MCRRVKKEIEVPESHRSFTDTIEFWCNASCVHLPVSTSKWIRNKASELSIPLIIHRNRAKRYYFHRFPSCFFIITILSNARAFAIIWFILIKCRIKKELFLILRLTVRIEISFPARLTLICGHDNKILMGENEYGWISGIRPIGVLIIHVSACTWTRCRHTTQHAANICLISSIKGRSVYSSHFRLADLLCNIQHGVWHRCLARGDRIAVDFHGNQDAYKPEIFFDRGGSIDRR